MRSAPDDGIVKQRKGEFLIRSILAYNQEQILRWPHLYASALEEWADRLAVDPPKLNKLVLVREAVSSGHLH